ncbi:MAG: TlpA family protein disulfide reductase [Gammaproteobacteria bacterium]|jgi:peroxiredoxin|nr:TlpA family protein disulfide reductase [Gammaproteobacteria bacterium]MBT3723211.1 TlpA family protein disulfide reductase [Gammaproteobacteria bacterium]MBT4077955.1 TlpA family protein disulfide reductase [Gammaproteobacteria bacterium]MBT4193742.1 TlpA family protein disulfide reductase [Gammaproteobacteria bacterium]MBT4450145.1 TlpA family protein disulfide reductase [Gammaproteobacteria bacterium]
MKAFNIFILSCFIALFSAQASSASGTLKLYKGNLSSPEFNLTDMQGNKHSLSDYQGNIVLLQFWATYCTPCRKEMPTMNNLIKKMDGKPFKILTVNMAEAKPDVQKFIDQVPVDFPVLLDSDGAILSQWKVFAAPANFILDKKGNILFTLYGGIEWDSEEMVKKLSTLTSM